MNGLQFRRPRCVSQLVLVMTAFLCGCPAETQPVLNGTGQTQLTTPAAAAASAGATPPLRIESQQLYFDKLQVGVAGLQVEPSEYSAKLMIDTPGRFRCRVVAQRLASERGLRQAGNLLNVALVRSSGGASHATSCTEVDGGPKDDANSKVLDCNAGQRGPVILRVWPTDHGSTVSFGVTCSKQVAQRQGQPNRSGPARNGGERDVQPRDVHAHAERRTPDTPQVRQDGEFSRTLTGVSEGDTDAARLLMLSCPASLTSESSQLHTGARGRVSIGKYVSSYKVVDADECQIEIEQVGKAIPESALARKSIVRFVGIR